MPLELDARKPGFAAKFERLMKARASEAGSADGVAARIVADVRKRGDAALVAYTNRFDRVRLTPAQLRVTPREIAAALKACDRETVRALELAASRIAAFHARQCRRTRCGRTVRGFCSAGDGRLWIQSAFTCPVGLRPTPRRC